MTKSVIKKAPGLWQLNTALSADADVVESVRDEIKIVLTEIKRFKFYSNIGIYEV